MEYLSDVTLLSVVMVNVAIIIVSCILNTATEKHPKKMNMIATNIMLSINLVFDVAVLVYFWQNAMLENGKIFVLFLPLTGWLWYENEKDIRVNF